MKAPQCGRCRRRHDPEAGCWSKELAARLLAVVLEVYGDTCHLCGRPGADSADHLTPRSRYGLDTLDNTRPAHNTPCNSRRGDMTLQRWFELYPITPPTYTPSRDW